jgi:ribulose-phosphate 3-epimerase
VVRIAPSIIAADFWRLGEEVRRAEEGGANLLHVDVMDGHFVPNLTVGPLVVDAIRRHTDLPLDVHLMITEPDRYLEAFSRAGAWGLTVHVEACLHLHRTVARIQELGCRAGVALNPATPLRVLEEILPEVDLVLVMSVNPGFSGQTFIPATLDKVRRLRRTLDERGLSADIQVDGGIQPANARALVEAGATILVAASAVFGQGKDPAATVRALRAAIEREHPTRTGRERA